MDAWEIKKMKGDKMKRNIAKECLKLFWVAFKAVNIMALLLLIVYLFPYFVDTIVTMLNAPETSANTLKILPYIPLAVLSLSLFWCSYLMVRVIGGGFRK